MHGGKPIQDPLNVHIRIYDLATGEEVQNRVINYHILEKRQWLQKLCVWAWHNHHSIEMYNLGDAELAKALDNAADTA